MTKDTPRSEDSLSVDAVPSAQPPESIWNKPLKADVKGLFKALGKAAVHGFALKWTDLASDVGDAVAAVGLETKPEELVWVLVQRSLRRAVASLVYEARDVFTPTKKTVEFSDSLADDIEAKMAENSVKVDRHFFDRPGEIELIPATKKALTMWLLGMGLEESKALGVSSRLPSYFTFALQEEWRKDRATYEPIQKILDTPFVKAQERESLWNLYAAWLDCQADRRMFGRDEANINTTIGVTPFVVQRGESMLFAEKLRSLRDAKGWSQKELADRSGTTQQAVARWETGERIPGFDHVQAMCKALGVPCTVFDGVEHAEVDEKRARGRPPKVSAATATEKPAKGKPRKGRGA